MNIEGTNYKCTGHAETQLMEKASMKYTKDFLWGCTLYSTAEPCAMCTGAIYWGNVGRIVYGMSEKDLLKITGVIRKIQHLICHVGKYLQGDKKTLRL